MKAELMVSKKVVEKVDKSEQKWVGLKASQLVDGKDY
jgi:hypothetical protein